MNKIVALVPARHEELPELCKNLQEAFAAAVIETFGALENGPIPADREVWESFDAPGGAVYHVTLDGQRVGGVVVNINEATQHNHLDCIQKQGYGKLVHPILNSGISTSM